MTEPFEVDRQTEVIRNQIQFQTRLYSCPFCDGFVVDHPNELFRHILNAHKPWCFGAPNEECNDCYLLDACFEKWKVQSSTPR